jgi:HAE1 family hydrophobic/amphiphilic exporter-1
VKEPRVSRFDPASQPVFNVAVTSPDGSVSVQELTTYADQVLQEAAGERARRGVGQRWWAACKREINIYLKPAALEAFGVGASTR